MENKLLLDIKNYLLQLKTIRDSQQTRFSEISDYSQVFIKPMAKRGNHVYYGIRKPEDNEFRYLGNESKPEIRLIRESRYLSKSIETIEHDIALLEDFLTKYESISYGSIDMKLPKTYRSGRFRADMRSKAAKKWKLKAEAYKATFEPYRPEELVQPTIDGKMVRSKSEALIYNFLTEAGYTFVYELPVKGLNRTFYPDFTILSEIDYKTEIRIEHQGMYDKNDYRDRSEAREYDYWSNGFLPARDVYFTFDDNKGGFDIGPILEILKSRVRPE